MLPVISSIAKPSVEVISGQVYGVVQLYKVLDDRPALEKEPAQVFARTYLTDALKTALQQMSRKFAGEDFRGSLVFTGGYGSGKSHQLLALYHALTSPDLAASWLSGQDYKDRLSWPAGLIPIVLHTARVDYDNLWDPIFRKLGATDVLQQVKRYPTIPQIRQALAGRPVVIFIDEIENWYETILPQQAADAATSRAANRTFLQHLLEVANEPDVPLAVLFSLIRENRELVDVIDRTHPVSINLSTAADREDVLLYRLFERIDHTAAGRVVDQFIQLYRERQVPVPMGDYDAYRERMRRVYPLHPELLRVLFERYSTASNYANTRGVLYLLAEILREKANCVPLLLSADVDAGRFADDLVALDRPLVEATARDIERVGHIPQGRQILSTILLYSINREQQIGADEAHVVMGVASPEVNPNDVLLGLNRLLGQAWHLHKLNGKYAIRQEENVFAVVQNRARDVDADLAIKCIAQVLAKEVLKGNTYVHEIEEIPDDRHLKVVVSLHALDTDQEVYALYHGRRYQNRMVVLAPLSGDLRRDTSLLDKARRILGGESILKDVSEERAKKVQDIIDEEQKELRGRLKDLFGFWPKIFMMVTEEPGGQKVEQEAIRKLQVEPDTTKLLERAASDISRIQEKILDVLQARGTQGLRTDILYSDFYMIRHYPLVSDASAVTAALKELCQTEQVYIEGHNGRNYFGETPYGLDEQSKAMLYHHSFVQVQRGEQGQPEEVKVQLPTVTAPTVVLKEVGEAEAVKVEISVAPQNILRQERLEGSGKHPRVVASKFEAQLHEGDVIQRVQVEMSHDFAIGGQSDKLERAAREMGIYSSGLKLKVTAEWAGPLTKANFLKQLLTLPATPGGNLSVLVEVDRANA